MRLFSKGSVFIFIAIIVKTISTEGISVYKYKLLGTLNDQISTNGDAVFLYSNSSRLRCISQCTLLTNCVSVFYSSLLCKGFAVVYSPLSVSLIPMPGTRYYISDPSSSAGDYTTLPVSDTTPPVSDTSPLVSDTTPPVSETSTPVSDTSPPVSDTSPPVSDTLPPVSDTSPPVSDTSPPVSDTSPPVSDTSPPVSDTSPPVSDTSPPVSDTSPPVSDTSPPVSDTSPPVSDTSQPASDTSPPVSDTSPPVSDTSPPVSDTSPPVSDTSPPVSDTSPPVSDTSPPVSDTSPPVSDTSPPVSDTSPPVSELSPPVSDTSPPVSDTSTQLVQTTAPTGVLTTVNVLLDSCNSLNALGYVWNVSEGICYRLHTFELDGAGATAKCPTEHVNSRLFLIDSDDTYNFVKNIIDTYNTGPIYLQGRRSGSNLVDDNGQVMTYFRWDSGEPSGSGNYIRTDTDTRLQETSGGSYTYKFICRLY